jgi:phenylalanyl-tRNA synthetase beta chain
MTISVVEPPLSEAFSPWSDAPPLQLSLPILRRADLLRRSLVPSLLQARRTNETIGNAEIELFEIARAYLPQPGGLPNEELLLAITSGRHFFGLKGILEGVVATLNPTVELTVAEYRHELFAPGRAVELQISGARLGFLGEVSAAGLKRFELRGGTTVAEIRIAALDKIADLIPQAKELSPYPAVERDVNLVVAENVHWSDIADAVRTAAGADLEQLTYRDTYRDAERLGAGKKSLLFSLTLRRPSGTLTSAEADQVRDAVVAACAEAFAAQLRA